MKSVNRGQILSEVVVAIGLLAIVLVGMSELISRSTVVIRLNKQKDEAARVAEARLSYLKQERDRDANVFFTSIVHNLDGGMTDCGVNPWPIPTQYTFTCDESFTSVSSGVQVDVRASWTDKTTDDMSVTLSTIITQP